MATNIFFENAAVHNAANELITNALLDLDRATPGDESVDYKSLYFFLFNGITDVLGISAHPKTANALKKLQCDSEDLFMEQAENKGKVIPRAKSKP